MTPLVDLHRHLEGSIRPTTSVEFATRRGSGIPAAQWRSALVATEREEGLLPYLAKIENATALVRTLDDWHRVTAEAVAITSHIQTGAARSHAQHQLATLLAAGVRVALCTDNPAVSDTRLTREYQLALDLVDEASVDLIRRNALAARFTSPGGTSRH